MPVMAESIPRYEPPDVPALEPESVCETCSHAVEIWVGRRRELVCVALHDTHGTGLADLMTEPLSECSEWERFDV